MGNWITALGLPEVIEGLLCCTTSTFTALCSSCSTKYPRFLFVLFLVLGTILSFLVLTPNMRRSLDKLPYFCSTITTEEMCDNLVGYGAVYRICFALAIFYGVFSLFMLNTTSSKDLRVKFHNGFWFLKLVLLVAILVGAFHIPRRTEFGQLFMYVGLTAGFIFIMIQILLVIDFAHSWSYSWGEKMESGNSIFWGFALVFSTILLYSIAITMAVFYYLYFTDLQNLSKCRGNMFLISFNVLHCLLASIVSVLSCVQDSAPGSGLLQSSIVSLYTMYLTWCTLSSEPDSSCNPMGDVILEYDKVSGVNGQAIFDCVLMFALLIFACNVRSSTSKLEKIGFSLSKYPTREDHSLSYLDKNDAEKYIGEKYVEDENTDLEYNYSFFHFVMFLASLQLMMIITNWHSPDELADFKKLVKNWATVWIQLSSSFLCVLFYIWVSVTPLIVRTWGPCLGLDYESVPTEDDYERLRRRREMLRERKGKNEKLKSRTKERTDGSLRENFERRNSNSEQIEELGNLSTSRHNFVQEESRSKNLGGEHRVNISEQRSEQNLENLSLSSVKARGDQITEDSGLCDMTNLTSLAISRESLRESESRDTERLDHTNESSRTTVHNERTRTDTMQRVDNLDNDTTCNTSFSPEHRSESSHKMLKEKQRNKLRNGDDNHAQSSFSKKQRNRNVKTHSFLHNPLPNRPYSSMAFITKTSRKDCKDNHALTIRPASCEPSLTLQNKMFSQQKKKESSLAFEEDSSMEKTSSSSQQYVQREVSSQEADDAEQELPCVKEPANLRESPVDVVQNSNETLSRSKEKEKCREDISISDSKPNTNKNNYATITPLKMKDHLKWVKRLRRTKGTLLNKRSTSENNAQDVFVEKKAKQTEGNDESEEALRNVSTLDDTDSCKINTKLKEEHLQDDKQEKNTATAGKGESMETFVNTFKTTNCKQNNTMNINEEETLKQSSNQSLQETASNEFAQQTRRELHTSDVAKEILRLQQKILKFQAKVVKTQQKIYEMHQEGNL